jgi:Putative member of DMT superfamily (DUF486)
MPTVPSFLLPLVLLPISNEFMTFAWYGHRKFIDRPLWIVVLVSWCIAFIEYCLAVPANRLVRLSIFQRSLRPCRRSLPSSSLQRLSAVPEGIIHAQPLDRLCFDRGRRVLCLQGADLTAAIVSVVGAAWRKEPANEPVDPGCLLAIGGLSAEFVTRGADIGRKRARPCTRSAPRKCRSLRRGTSPPTWRPHGHEPSGPCATHAATAERDALIAPAT